MKRYLARRLRALANRLDPQARGLIWQPPTVTWANGAVPSSTTAAVRVKYRDVS